MNKHYSIIWLLMSSLCLSLSAAQATESVAKTDLKAKLRLLKTFDAGFKQTVVDIDNNVLQQASGHIVLQQPNKLHWELFEPNESVLLVDGSNIWNIDPFLEQVIVYSLSANTENNPIVLLTNPDSDKWSDYSVSYADGRYIIRALQADSAIVMLSLDFQDGQLVALESIDGQQQRSQLSFTDIQQNAMVDPNKFVFVQQAGYELDDQRTP